MAEPATSTAAVIASALGLTVFGVATGYQVMSEVESGARGPLSVAEYIDLLPVLELP